MQYQKKTNLLYQSFRTCADIPALRHPSGPEDPFSTGLRDRNLRIYPTNGHHREVHGGEPRLHLSGIPVGYCRVHTHVRDVLSQKSRRS